jgi:hypothetical protein
LHLDPFERPALQALNPFWLFDSIVLMGPDLTWFGVYRQIDSRRET